MIDYLPKIKFAAKLSGVLFAGGAIYCTLVEHPSMLECGTKAAADHWHVRNKNLFKHEIENVSSTPGIEYSYEN
jgi:hypothetical protein